MFCFFFKLKNIVGILNTPSMMGYKAYCRSNALLLPFYLAEFMKTAWTCTV